MYGAIGGTTMFSDVFKFFVFVLLFVVGMMYFLNYFFS